jgi:hypothetical protein
VRVCHSGKALAPLTFQQEECKSVMIFCVNGRQYEHEEAQISGNEIIRLSGSRDTDLLFFREKDILRQFMPNEIYNASRRAEFFTTQPRRVGSWRDFFRVTWNTFLSLTGLVLAILGGLLGIFNYMTAKDLAAENSGYEALKNSYAKYYDLGRELLRAPEVSHIYALKGSYQAVVNDVRVHMQDADKKTKAHGRLLERAMADYIFTAFEETLLDYRMAQDSGDQKRTQIDEDRLAYFTGDLLRNPRLVWWWWEDGGGLVEEYTKETREYYAAKVGPPTHCRVGDIEVCDPTSPFDYDR